MPRHLTEQQELFRLALYGEELNDCEVAYVLNCASSAIWHWRKARGLSKNCERGLPPVEEQDLFRLALYGEGLTDSQISYVVGCTDANIRKWRYKRYLDINKSWYLSEDEELFRLGLYGEGLSDRQIAYIVNRCKGTVQRWRKRRGLPVLGKVGHKLGLDEEEDLFRLALYGEGLTDNEMAKVLDMNQQSVSEWRTVRNLDQNVLILTCEVCGNKFEHIKGRRPKYCLKCRHAVSKIRHDFAQLARGNPFKAAKLLEEMKEEEDEEFVQLAVDGIPDNIRYDLVEKYGHLFD